MTSSQSVLEWTSFLVAGTDFGAQLTSPGPKADLAFPTSVGECTSQEPALVPSKDVVSGIAEIRTGTPHAK